MPTWIVRHACAGHKEDWTGPDDDRPLDPAGQEQSAALASLLASRAIRRLVASPTVRCIETLVPLARLTGLEVERSARLRWARGAPLAQMLADEAFEGSVLCTHGEVMEPALQELRSSGLEVIDGHDDAALLLKGAAWAIDRRTNGWQLALHVPVVRTTCPHHAEEG